MEGARGSVKSVQGRRDIAEVEGPPWVWVLRSKLFVWTGVNGKQEQSRSRRARNRNLSREEVQTEASRR